eukprot:TRINITY_DN4579_c0_g3_i2.p3 TRINITY_DN4579_c0_g3~~TRINITY_DN4579_c0_g3_i2.p3  ORF type:complete len:103 (+),score=13.13 TRINITY_DN4579_c0_g3_i2:503-811(+)
MLGEMQTIYLRRGLDALVEALDDSLEESRATVDKMKLASILVFYLAMALIYLIAQFRFVSFLTKRVLRTQEMLTMLPNSVILSSPALKTQLKHLIKTELRYQ